MDRLSGTFTAVVTPFTEDGSAVDFSSFAQLLEFQINEKVDGLVVCGSTGEAATLSDEEYRSVLRFACQTVRKRVPVIGGVGASSTSRAVAMAKTAEDSGVDLVMVVAPPYNKPPQEGLVAHFQEVKKAVKLAIVCYNVPGRTGVNILPRTYAKLAERGTIRAIKEASGSVEQILEVIAAVEGRAAVFSGDDGLTLPVMSGGGVGVISVLSNIEPGRVNAITHAVRDGRWEDAKRAQLAAIPYCRAMFMETNPIPVKTALALKGIIKHPTLRLPLIPAELQTVEKLSSLFKE